MKRIGISKQGVRSMNKVQGASRLLAVLLPLVMAACTTQPVPPSASAEVVKPAANAAPVAAAAPRPTLAASAARSSRPLPPPSALEAQSGIQITQIGLAASGGLVDVRFKVLDPAKVRALLGNPANAPQLIAGDKPPLMPPHQALHGAKYGAGQIFYILYPNQRGAVQTGSEVSVAIGELRLGPVTVQ
jgi:hypothetical protein